MAQEGIKMFSVIALAKLAALQSVKLEKRAFNSITTPIAASTQLAQGINKQFPVQNVNLSKINNEGANLHNKLTNTIPYDARHNQWYSKQFNQNAKSNFYNLLDKQRKNYEKKFTGPYLPHPYHNLAQLTDPGFYANYRASNPLFAGLRKPAILPDAETNRAYGNHVEDPFVNRFNPVYPTEHQQNNAFLNPNYYGYGITKPTSQFGLTKLTPNQQYLFNMMSLNEPLTEFATNSAKNLARFAYPPEKPNDFAQLFYDYHNLDPDQSYDEFRDSRAKGLRRESITDPDVDSAARDALKRFQLRNQLRKDNRNSPLN